MRGDKSANSEPIHFANWGRALEKEAFSPAQRDLFHAAIVRFLRHCKTLHAPATVSLIRTYLAEREGQGGDREALRWFYQASKTEQPGSAPSAETRSGHRTDLAPLSRAQNGGIPPIAKTDQGGADWERDLITAIRSKGYLWRTEETYRAWGARFAQFLHPRSPYAADAEDVGAFLTSLAVRQRAMPSTQKQALNAVVFLLQEALKKQLGKIPFQRAFARRRVPTVLSRQECQRLFLELKETPRLMAELAYGSGLRLMELLRLRVHHLDFERQQLRVFGGKGDRVNGCANAVV